MSDRFPYGKNWLNYLRVVNETHISKAASSLASLVGEVRGKSFLDIGSGSGIHSLAALRLGASRVHSFDYDPQSVEASREMKRRFAPNAEWTIEQGSALDEPYLRSLGPFDIVYSWGVLHTTGDMWRALDLVRIPARELLAVAVYHDCGASTRKWKEFKRIYNKVPAPLQLVMEVGVLWNSWGKFFIRRPAETWRKWRDYIDNRGQTPWYDIVDWAGGYPFEFASTESVISFYQQRGCSLRECRPASGQGCDEYVFSIPASQSENTMASSYSGQSNSISA